MWIQAIREDGVSFLINTQYSTGINREGKEIKMYLPSGNDFQRLGKYKSEERAEEVFVEIREALSSGTRVFGIPRE